MATKITEKNITVKSKPTLAQQRERDGKPVRGRFNFLEVPGGTLRFAFRKYKGEKIKNYSLKDGEIYTIPRSVAKHLNTAGRYPVHEYQTDETGKPIIRIGRYKRRYNFESLEFLDDLGPNDSNLYTVEKV